MMLFEFLYLLQNFPVPSFDLHEVVEVPGAFSHDQPKAMTPSAEWLSGQISQTGQSECLLHPLVLGSTLGCVKFLVKTEILFLYLQVLYSWLTIKFFCVMFSL